MNTRILLNQNSIVFILVTILMFAFGTQSISYAQEANPILTISFEEQLTEANLHGIVFTLTISGGRFIDSEWHIKDAISFSGIDGITVKRQNLKRVSDTVVTFKLDFSGNIDSDSTLTITVGTEAIGIDDYIFVLQFPVPAVEESLEVSTEAPLSEVTLHENIITLTLTGRQFAEERILRRALSISGIEGVTFDDFWDVDRVSDTVVTIELEFAGNLDTDATLTLTVGANAIAGYDKDFTFQLPVTAVEESLEASTETPLTEATLHGSIITLTLTGVIYKQWVSRSDVTFSGIEGVTFVPFSQIDRVNDTEARFKLRFSGNIDTDTNLVFTVGADAIEGYNGKSLTASLPVKAGEESLTASTEEPLTEATLDGSVITLNLTGRRFAHKWAIRDALSFSGIEGVTIIEWWGVNRVSDTVATVTLLFTGNIDTDATLTLIVGPEAIVGGYDKDFTFQFPVTAVGIVSLEASTAAPLTEVNLNDSIVTLNLTGSRFADTESIIDALSISGIKGVTVAVNRVNDTAVTVYPEFNGIDFDTDATLTFTVGPGAIAGYNKELTVQIPVTAIQDSNATVSISPASVACPDIGKELRFNLNIRDGKNVAGYQATVLYNDTALDYVRSAKGDYLPEDAFFFGDTRIAATTLAEAANGDGTLATLTFKVKYYEASTLTLSEVYLVGADGKRWEVTTENAEVIIPPEPHNHILGDINRDGVVNIQDLVIVNVHFGQRGRNSADINGDRIVNIMDLVLVAGAFGNGAAAPALSPQSLEMLTAADIQRWLSQAQQLELTDARSLRGILFLKQLLATLIPDESALLPNYPNPFNPETWIPYRLSKPADVTLTIYAVDGQMVRHLALGHQPAGIYQSRFRAAYWDGKNAIGEPVTSGLYFYTLTAGNFTATRKMLIKK